MDENEGSGDDFLYIVEKFLKPEKIALFKGGDWAKEVRVAKKLLSQRPIFFWRLFELKFQLNSLCFFLSKEGKKYLEQSKIEIDKSEKIPVFERKKMKPQTLMDFVKRAERKTNG